MIIAQSLRNGYNVLVIRRPAAAPFSRELFFGRRFL